MPSTNSRASKRIRELEAALRGIFDCLLELEPYVTRDTAEPLLRAFALCKYLKQPEWSHRIDEFLRKEQENA